VCHVIPSNPPDYQVQVLKTFLNLGPALDLEFVNSDENSPVSQIIHCGPLGLTSLQRIAMVTEEAMFEQKGVTKMFAVKVRRLAQIL